MVLDGPQLPDILKRVDVEAGVPYAILFTEKGIKPYIGPTCMYGTIPKPLYLKPISMLMTKNFPYKPLLDYM